MADNDAFKKRSQELFSQHEEFKDISLRLTFHGFLFDFKTHEYLLAGEAQEEQLALMGVESDFKMSDEGLAMLRQAAENEVDEWTADLRKKEKVLDQLCAELRAGDVFVLNRLLVKVGEVWNYSKFRRYEKLLASLSEHDRTIVDRVLLERGSSKSPEIRLPLNAAYIYDTLAMEFPDIVLEEARRQCERYERDKGKHYVQFHERSPDGVSYDGSGNFTTGVISFTSGYRLVDE